MLKRMFPYLSLAGLLLFAPISAKAQFSSTFASYSTNPLQGPPGNPTVPKETPFNSEKYYGTVGLFPVAFFDTGGIFATGVAGTHTLGGGLISLDFGKLERGEPIKNKPNERESVSRARYELGGWYWGRTGSDLYEIHLRAVAKNGLGIQVGYLNTTQGFLLRPGTTASLPGKFEAQDAFLLYEIHGNRKNSKWKNWTIQFGGGMLIDDSPHLLLNQSNQINPAPSTNSLVNLTFYVSGSISITRNIALTASDWVIRDGGQDLNRVALGVGYKFF